MPSQWHVTGRDYDKHGNLDPWWQKETSRRFKQKTQCMIKQYSSFTTQSGEHLNGKLTLGTLFNIIYRNVYKLVPF